MGMHAGKATQEGTQAVKQAGTHVCRHAGMCMHAWAHIQACTQTHKHGHAHRHTRGDAHRHRHTCGHTGLGMQVGTQAWAHTQTSKWAACGQA